MDAKSFDQFGRAAPLVAEPPALTSCGEGPCVIVSVWRLGRPTPHEWQWQKVDPIVHEITLGPARSWQRRERTCLGFALLPPGTAWPAHQLASRRCFSQSPWLASTSRVRGGRSIGGPSSSVRLQSSRSMISPGLVVVAFGVGHGGEVEAADLSYGAGAERGATASRARVSSPVEAVGGDDVRDVDDRTAAGAGRAGHRRTSRSSRWRGAGRVAAR